MGILLRVLIAAGLAVDAYVHIVLAGAYDSVVSGGISQGDLFRIQGGVAGLVALLTLVVPGRWVFGLAFLVAASAFGAVVLYRYVDVGVLGPLPNMYEPVWMADKLISAIAEVAAASLALVAFLRARRPGAHSGKST